MKDKFKDTKGIDKAYMSLANHYTERKEKAIRQVKDGAFVDLLNQEMEELQRAKQIEEMAKELEKDINTPMYSYHYLASKLQPKGWVKLLENSVVISREEYEKLKSLYDSQQGAIMTSSIGDLPLTVEGLRKAVDEIARLIGVQTELQELNAKYYNEAKDLRRELIKTISSMYNEEEFEYKVDKKVEEELDRVEKEASKETAKKILNELLVGFRKNFYLKNMSMTEEEFSWVLDEIAREFAVEIKE